MKVDYMTFLLPPMRPFSPLTRFTPFLGSASAPKKHSWLPTLRSPCPLLGSTSATIMSRLPSQRTSLLLQCSSAFHLDLLPSTSFSTFTSMYLALFQLPKQLPPYRSPNLIPGGCCHDQMVFKRVKYYKCISTSRPALSAPQFSISSSHDQAAGPQSSLISPPFTSCRCPSPVSSLL